MQPGHSGLPAPGGSGVHRRWPTSAGRGRAPGPVWPAG